MYCYGRIVWILTRKIDSNLDNTEKNISENDSVLSRRYLAARNNTIKTFLLVGICFIIYWVNDEVYYLMYNLGYNADWNGTYFKFCVIMVFLNCTVNPFVSLIKYQDYQEALRYLFTKEKAFSNRSHSSSETSVSWFGIYLLQYKQPRAFGIKHVNITQPRSKLYKNQDVKEFYLFAQLRNYYSRYNACHDLESHL